MLRKTQHGQWWRWQLKRPQACRIDVLALALSNSSRRMQHKD